VDSDSCSEFGVLDKVLSVFLLDDGVNKGVEFGEVVDLVLHSLESSGVGVEVGSLAEEFSAETFVGVDVDSVLVVVSCG
jgi:hypothetical protein